MTGPTPANGEEDHVHPLYIAVFVEARQRDLQRTEFVRHLRSRSRRTRFASRRPLA